MANGDTEGLSQQRQIIADINKLYAQINESLIQQLVNQESIAAQAAGEGAATQEEIRNRLADLRSDLGSTEAAAVAAGGAVTGVGTAATASAAATTAAAEEGVGSMTSLGDVAAGITRGVQALGNTWDETSKTIATNAAGTLRPEFVRIQEAYGGLTLGAMNSADGTIEAGNAMAGAMQKVAIAINTAQYSFATFGEGGRTATLPLQAALGETSEIMEVFNEMAINQGLINGMSMAELAMSSAGEESIKQMRMVQLGLGLTMDETSTFVQRQISLTGKAGTDMLTEAAMSAKAVAKTVGSSAKLIGKSMQEIIADTEHFGNVTVDEAARISGTLAQLGIDYKDLGGMINKYMSFEGAVDSISALTSVFGVQLDSMEMMRLANEDQEGFLRKMRESFIMTGKSVDDMNLAEKRLIKSQLGLQDIESVERLLDPGRALTSIEELTAATDEMAPEEAADRTMAIMQDLGDEILSMADLTKYSTDAMATFFQEGLIAPLHEARIAAEQTMAATAGKGMAVTGPAMEGAQAGATEIQEMFASTVGPAKAAMTELAESMKAAFLEVKQVLCDTELINCSPSVWDKTFRDNAPEAIDATTDALLSMTDEAKSAFDGLTQGPMDDFLTALGDGIPESMSIAQSEMDKFATMSQADLKALMKDADGAGARLAQQIGFLQERGGELTEEGQRALAEQLQLGDDWKDKMEIIMSSQADEAGAAQAKQGDAVTDMIESYKDMGMTLEKMGGVEGDWAKAYQAEYGLSDEDLVAAFAGGEDAQDVGSIVREALDRGNIEAREERAEGVAATTRAREEYEASRGEGRGGGRGQAAQTRDTSANTAAISALTREVSALQQSMTNRPIVINLGGQAITDYIIEHPDGRTSSVGNTIALETSRT